MLLALGFSRCSDSLVSGATSLAGESEPQTTQSEATARGLDSLRIKKVSYGKERPLIKGSNEEAWAKNRRVEINGE